MLKDQEYTELYDLYKRLMSEEEAPRLVIYHPDVFIELSREIVRLHRKMDDLQKAANNYYFQCQINWRLRDEIEYCKKLLKKAGIHYKFTETK